MAAEGARLTNFYVRKELELSLFDLEKDPGETTNVAAGQPEVVSRLMQLVERAREDLGDSLTKRTGKNVRPPGRLPPRLHLPAPRNSVNQFSTTRTDERRRS